jgi:L-fuculose-phosphate aldolase
VAISTLREAAPALSSDPRAALTRCAWILADEGHESGLAGQLTARGPDEGTFWTLPLGLAFDEAEDASWLLIDDAMKVLAGDGSYGIREPNPATRFHLWVYRARADVQAIVHTHSLFSTTISILRRPIPAVHYMVVLAGSDEIPCAEYATFGSAELALNAVTALRGGAACLLANHGMVALGATLPAALRIAAEVETLASQYWHAAQVGDPHVLDHEELTRVRARFAEYGQHKAKTRSR